MFATAEERYAARVAVRLARIHAWRSDAGESDHRFATSHRDCCNRREARLRASASRNLAAHPRATACDLSYCMRLALRAHLAEVRYAAPWQLGCCQRSYLVAGIR